MGKKVLIVGGVAGGASAATRLRRLDETAEIILFERDEYISFANCGLPYYIGGTIQDRSKLLVQTPEEIAEKFLIDVRINSEVMKLNTDKKCVTVQSRTRGCYEESYDYLILAPGAGPLKPNIKGIDSTNIFTLRNIPDTDKIKQYVEEKNIKNAIVIGGGFIGVEMAENLRERGLNVTLVEAAPHILASFDSDIAVIAEKELADNKVKLILNDGVSAFEDLGQSVAVTMNSGKTLVADIVILGMGVVPDTRFLQDSQIALGPKGHIQVNEKMETNIPGIYAVGDAIEVVHFITGQKTAIPLAGPANKQGRIAADNVAGVQSLYKGSQGTSILKIFELTAASTGVNERSLKIANMPYHQVIIHPASHASYYPGAIPMTLKLLFSPEGKILGAQGIGYEGVDKRIDVIAAVIRLGGCVEDLTELELSYAPPYSTAKDPVNMAGFAAQNIINGISHMVTWEEVEQTKESYTLLDVRSREEFLNGHIEGAVNIPLDDLRNHMDQLDHNKVVVAYCQVGQRGYLAERILSQNGFKVWNINGGYKHLAAHYKHNDQDSNLEEEKTIMEKLQDQIVPSHITLDACGLSCPGPLMKVKTSVDQMENGQIITVTASDPGFYEDIRAWCKRTGNELVDLSKASGKITAIVKKGSRTEAENQTVTAAQVRDNKTMVVFSGDLDKAIASFIIANGAAAMGKKVTMFFTFWGLNILRKPERVKVQKDLIGKMFGRMMPRGSYKLGLSKMNMLGMGGRMIRKVMKDKNVSSLEELIKSAIDSGIEIVACQMSMDVMGLKQEELIDGVKVGGVGYYLGEAEDANMNLFI